MTPVKANSAAIKKSLNRTYNGEVCSVVGVGHFVVIREIKV